MASRTRPIAARTPNARDHTRYIESSALLAVSDEVLARAARPFQVEPIRALDAIHLSTIMLLGEAPQLLTVVTRDAHVAQNASAMGHVVA